MEYQKSKIEYQNKMGYEKKMKTTLQISLSFGLL